MVFPTPDWIPLERALVREYGETAREAAASFYFLGREAGPDDVGDLRIYEHATTRRRLVLDTDGRAYRRHADLGHFSPIALDEALVAALS
jgi:hypothetical protein